MGEFTAPNPSSGPSTKNISIESSKPHASLMVPLRVERWREQPPLLGGVHLIGGGEAVAFGWLIRNMGRPAVRESIGPDQGRIDKQDTDHLVVGTVARHNLIVPRDGFVSHARQF
jgi:hypothetical protein